MFSVLGKQSLVFTGIDFCLKDTMVRYSNENLNPMYTTVEYPLTPPLFLVSQFVYESDRNKFER